MGNTRIEAIQGLRGIAALAVVAAHSINILVQRADLDPSYRNSSEVLGLTGVQIFFIISGFIMVITTYNAFGRKGATREFLIKRLIRIVPIYWVATFLYVALSSVANRAFPAAEDLIRSLLFIPYENDHGLQHPVYGIGWTLNYEMFFYGLFGVALLVRRTAALAAVLIALSSLALLGVAGVSSFYTNPIILYFAAGIALALLRLRFQASLPMLSAPAVCGIAILVLIGYFAYLRGTPVTTAPQVVVSFAIAALGALTQAKPVQESLLRKTVSAIGDASYGIYLTHSFLVLSAGRVWAHLFGSNAWICFIVLMLIGASALGMIAYRTLEVPTLKVLRKRFLPIRTEANLEAVRAQT